MEFFRKLMASGLNCLPNLFLSQTLIVTEFDGSESGD